jgi:hypothetical protein
MYQHYDIITYLGKKDIKSLNERNPNHFPIGIYPYRQEDEDEEFSNIEVVLSYITLQNKEQLIYLMHCQ